MVPTQVELKVWKYREGALREEIRGVATEYALTVVLNARELVTLLCSPDHLEELGVGYLFSEGLLKEREDIEGMRLDQEKGIFRIWLKRGEELRELPFKRVITPGCGRGSSLRTPLDFEALEPIGSGVILTPEEVLQLCREFQRASELWKATHGVHGCALSDPQRILVFRQDIGRHNALDKVLGHCFLEGIPTQDRVLLSSGRISSEMLLKAIRGRIPIVLSLSSATDQAVQLAERLGVTLVGSARGRGFVVYSHPKRIKGGEGR